MAGHTARTARAGDRLATARRRHGEFSNRTTSRRENEISPWPPIVPSPRAGYIFHDHILRITTINAPVNKCSGEMKNGTRTYCDANATRQHVARIDGCSRARRLRRIRRGKSAENRRLSFPGSLPAAENAVVPTTRRGGGCRRRKSRTKRFL